MQIRAPSFAGPERLDARIDFEYTPVAVFIDDVIMEDTMQGSAMSAPKAGGEQRIEDYPGATKLQYYRNCL